MSDFRSKNERNNGARKAEGKKGSECKKIRKRRKVANGITGCADFQQCDLAICYQMATPPIGENPETQDLENGGPGNVNFAKREVLTSARKLLRQAE